MTLKQSTSQLIFLLLVCKLNWCGGISCFQFPDIPHEIIIPENTTREMNVTFNFTCNSANAKLKYVNIYSIERIPNRLLCSILHTNGECDPAVKEPCKCNEFTYTIFHIISGPSEENWKMVAELENGIKFREKMTFYFREPAHITSLTVSGHGESVAGSSPWIVDVNSAVTITCTWEKGLSREVASLFINGHQVETTIPAIQKTPRRIDYTTNTKCHHNGTVSCGVPSALETRSEHLFVRCMPNFDESNYTFPDNSRHLLFAIKTHGLNITTCTLQKLLPHGIIDKSQARINRPKCQTLSTGILAVELENVTSHKVGTWHLKVWNRFGFDTVNFTLEDAKEVPMTFKETTAVIIATALAVFGVTVLTIAVAIMCRFRKGRLPGLPPPPAPHTFRRPAPDAVMFRVQPDAQDERVSFLSVQDHIYEVMPGEESTDGDLASSDSLSNADCLLRIACPSSESSLSEEDLRSIASTGVISASMMTRASETRSTPQTMKEAVGTSAASCKDVGVSRAFPNPVESVQEAATRPLENVYENTTSFRTNSSLKQPAHSSPKVTPTPRVPKKSASRTTGTKSGNTSDDYLHPIASGREEAYMPKTLPQPFQTTGKRSGKPPADYLHPIAPVHKEASTPGTTLQPSNNSVTKATSTQKENPPDEYLHRVKSDRKAASAQQNKPRILKTTVTKASDVQSGNPSDDYLHPTASTFEATSTSNSEQHSDPASATTTGAEWTSSTLHEDYLYPINSSQIPGATPKTTKHLDATVMNTTTTVRTPAVESTANNSGNTKSVSTEVTSNPPLHENVTN